MNAPNNNQPKMKALPIRAAWLGPPSGKAIVGLKANLLTEGIEVVKDGVDFDTGSVGDVDVCLGLHGMIRGIVLQKAVALAKRSGKQLVLVPTNARIAKQKLTEAGIKNRLVPAAPVIAKLNDDRDLRVPLMATQLRSNTTPTADSPPVAGPPAPPPISPTSHTTVVGQVTEEGLRRKMTICALLDGGPAESTTIAKCLVDEKLVTAEASRHTTNAQCAWLAECGFITDIDRKGGQGGFVKWARTPKPISREILLAEHDARARAGFRAAGRRAAQTKAKDRAAAMDANPMEATANRVQDFMEAKRKVDEILGDRQTYAAMTAWSPAAMLRVIAQTIEACDLGYGDPMGRKRTKA